MTRWPLVAKKKIKNQISLAVLFICTIFAEYLANG